MADLVAFKSINLKKKGVTVPFKEWRGDIPTYDSLKEVWINIVGIPPVWCSWKVIAQIVSSMGVIVNVDWHGIFRSFYDVVRVQVAVRDPQLIPKNKVVEIHQDLYLLSFEVEGDEATDSPDHKPFDDPSDPKNGDGNEENHRKNDEVDDYSNDDMLGEEMDHDNREKQSRQKVHLCSQWVQDKDCWHSSSHSCWGNNCWQLYVSQGVGCSHDQKLFGSCQESSFGEVWKPTSTSI